MNSNIIRICLKKRKNREAMFVWLVRAPATGIKNIRTENITVSKATTAAMDIKMKAAAIAAANRD